ARLRRWGGLLDRYRSQRCARSGGRCARVALGLAVAARQIAGRALPQERLREELDALVAGQNEAVGGIKLDRGIERLALLGVIDPALVPAAIRHRSQLAQHGQTTNRPMAFV